MARKRPTASNVVQPALTCIDGGRRGVGTVEPPGSPSLPRPQQPVAKQRLSPAVWALFDALQDRLQASEDRGRAVACEVVALRAALTQAQRRVDVLSFLQDGLEVRINDLDADAPAARDARRGLDPCPLSERELEILAHLAEGKVYKQIAREMCVSASTVRSHLHHVYGKLGTVDRAQAVLLASARGWL